MIVLHSNEIITLQELSIQKLKISFNMEEIKGRFYYIKVSQPKYTTLGAVYWNGVHEVPQFYNIDNFQKLHCEIGNIELYSMSLSKSNIYFESIAISNIDIWKSYDGKIYIYTVKVFEKNNTSNEFQFEFVDDYLTFFKKIIPAIDERLTTKEEKWESINFYFYYNYFNKSNEQMFLEPMFMKDGDFFEDIFHMELIPQIKIKHYDSPMPMLQIKNKYTYNSYIHDFLFKISTGAINLHSYKISSKRDSSLTY